MKIIVKHWTCRPFEVEREFETVIETDDICRMTCFFDGISKDEIKIEVLTRSIYPRKLRITDKQSIKDIFKHYGG